MRYSMGGGIAAWLFLLFLQPAIDCIEVSYGMRRKDLLNDNYKLFLMRTTPLATLDLRPICQNAEWDSTNVTP